LGKLLFSGQIFSTPPVKCLPVRLWAGYSKFSTGHGYPQTAFMWEPDADKNIRS